MKKYKLINRKTKEETICAKVNVDGFDYYVSNDQINYDDYYIAFENNYTIEPKERYVIYVKSTGLNGKNPRKILATNNFNIDIPKVIDEVAELANSAFTFVPLRDDKTITISRRFGFKTGYNKHKEINPFSEEDIIEFCKIAFDKCLTGSVFENNKIELLELWKEQKVETIYFN